MITINGLEFKENPTYCGICPFFTAGSNDKRGFCIQFDKYKSRYDNTPKRCKTLFTKAFETGGEQVIVFKRDDDPRILDTYQAGKTVFL